MAVFAFVTADDALDSSEQYIPPNPHNPIPPSWPPDKPPPEWHEYVKVKVEAIHQGGESENTNETITVPVGQVYRNTSVLNSVSTLYLLDNAAVTCIPYLSAMPTGPHGHPFTVGHPAVLSEGGAPVAVGNIVCTHAGQ